MEVRREGGRGIQEERQPCPRPEQGCLALQLTVARSWGNLWSRPPLHVSTLTLVCVCSVIQLCLTFCDPIDCSLPASSVHGILRQEYGNGSLCSLPRDLPNPGIRTPSPVSPALAGGLLTHLSLAGRLPAPLGLIQTTDHCFRSHPIPPGGPQSSGLEHSRRGPRRNSNPPSWAHPLPLQDLITALLKDQET